MEEVTYLAIVFVGFEALWRLYNCPISLTELMRSDFSPSIWFFIGYLLCIVMILLDINHIPFFQSPIIRNSIKILHAMDGIIALLIGAGFYFENNWILIFGILCVTKFFLLHLLSRMVTGVKTHSKLSIIVQTTKTFIHHTASFYFLFPRSSSSILLTSIWRFISMNGHAALTLRGKTAKDDWKHIALSEKAYDQVMWIIAHFRNAIVVVVLAFCYFDLETRHGFAISACGHIAYMIVRAIPVFRIASLYFPHSEEREKWENLTDSQRLFKLLSGEHLWLTLELSILFICSAVFVYLRITVQTQIDPQTCTFY